MLPMQKSRIAALLLLAMCAVAQQPPTVDITSEPSHHLVLQNEYVRVFDVTVAPRASTLVHRHDHDYLFVTLGDADVVSTRPGEQPVHLTLKDGETRFTAGNFAHAALNLSDQPFHNITIDLLQPSTGVKTCTESCSMPVPCPAEAKAACPTIERRILSDQWVLSFVNIPPASRLEKHTHAVPHLVVAVSNLDLTQQTDASTSAAKRAPGSLVWVPASVTHTISNGSANAAKFITLEFTANTK